MGDGQDHRLWRASVYQDHRVCMVKSPWSMDGKLAHKGKQRLSGLFPPQNITQKRAKTPETCFDVRQPSCRLPSLETSSDPTELLHLSNFPCPSPLPLPPTTPALPPPLPRTPTVDPSPPFPPTCTSTPPNLFISLPRYTTPPPFFPPPLLHPQPPTKPFKHGTHPQITPKCTSTAVQIHSSNPSHVTSHVPSTTHHTQYVLTAAAATTTAPAPNSPTTATLSLTGNLALASVPSGNTHTAASKNTVLAACASSGGPSGTQCPPSPRVQ